MSKKLSWPRWQTWREADWGVLARCLWLIPATELAVRWLPPRHWLPPASTTEEACVDATAGAQAAEGARRGGGAPLTDRDPLHQHFAPLNNTRAGLPLESR